MDKIENGITFKGKVDEDTNIGDVTKEVLSNVKSVISNNDSLDKIEKVVFEAEKNIKMYAKKGEIEINANNEVFKARFKDYGPGIENIALAFQDGYTTATENIKELGFGRGNGLSVIRDNVDYLDVASIPGVGTTLDIAITV